MTHKFNSLLKESPSPPAIRTTRSFHLSEKRHWRKKLTPLKHADLKARKRIPSGPQILAYQSCHDSTVKHSLSSSIEPSWEQAINKSQHYPIVKNSQTAWERIWKLHKYFTEQWGTKCLNIFFYLSPLEIMSYRSSIVSHDFLHSLKKCTGTTPMAVPQTQSQMQLCDSYRPPCYQAWVQKSPSSGIRGTITKTSEWLWFTKHVQRGQETCKIPFPLFQAVFPHKSTYPLRLKGSILSRCHCWSMSHTDEIGTCRWAVKWKTRRCWSAGKTCKMKRWVWSKRANIEQLVPSVASANWGEWDHASCLSSCTFCLFCFTGVW
jgi:hypothetical protein